MSDASELPVGIADVEAAAVRIRDQAVRTPLLGSAALDARAGGRVLLKAETLQRTGSFKFRGAYNLISALDPAERDRGVVAFSSGNHAQGVAHAASLLGWASTVVMPADAPPLKIERTRAFGATVVTYDRATESREEIAAALAARTGAVTVPPYDHSMIMAGQGTVGLELAAQAAERELVPDQVLVPCGGGGLTAGIATALADRLPRAVVRPVEPAGYDDTTRSLAAGERVANAAGASSICDALLAPTPGELTFAVNAALAGPGLVVDDDQVRAAVRWAFEELKLAVEPGGAVALAAVLAGVADTADRVSVVVLSGGNTDARWLT
ncbi:threonine dehydratase [Friedmanniella endophytica]|uniref:threonine ammonia-lyase n=1 Tax=Microlunatus kandeliicorticis TaxID=1759536 RepID=A0A7W3P4B4_9ACTN|nr:threonine/serine dehydratase [Microlunatus kandeliicorticis]MBA8792660.1 threonine dehydratase [Microlunatus kandeliicorticis]